MAIQQLRMHYKIIHNLDMIRGFVDHILPDLTQDERYYMCLFARKKYAPDMVQSSDHTQLARLCVRKEHILDELRKMEVSYGSYLLKGRIVPREALAVYINPNPRSMKKATKKLGKRIFDLYADGQNYNLVHEAVSAVQNSKSYTKWIDFDLDAKPDNIFQIMDEIVHRKYYRVVETRGGYHILVDKRWTQVVSKVISYREFADGERRGEPVWDPDIDTERYPPKWYHAIMNTFEGKIDNVGDQLLPFPGTTQGGFTPKLLV